MSTATKSSALPPITFSQITSRPDGKSKDMVLPRRVIPLCLPMAKQAISFHRLHRLAKLPFRIFSVMLRNARFAIRRHPKCHGDYLLDRHGGVTAMRLSRLEAPLRKSLFEAAADGVPNNYLNESLNIINKALCSNYYYYYYYYFRYF